MSHRSRYKGSRLYRRPLDYAKPETVEQLIARGLRTGAIERCPHCMQSKIRCRANGCGQRHLRVRITGAGTSA
jgi:hypothetical protein